MTPISFADLTDLFHEILSPDLIEASYDYNEPVLMVYAGANVRVLTLLRDNKKFRFRQLVDITAVDYPGKPQRFEVIYNLLSHTTNMRVRVKLKVDCKATVSSIVGVFPAADWYEREIWDLFGIPFEDHPDLRRILTDYNFEGHPLRKDFPLSGFTQVVYDPNQERVVNEPVKLNQNYRSFDFLSPWEGILQNPDLETS